MLPDDRLPTEGASLLTHPLAESWQRSRGYGLARADQHISFIKAGLLEERRSRNDWVPQRVQPLIEQLGAQITRQPAIVVIADADGLVLETRGNTDFLHKASRFALAPGNPWGEAERGTNAIGTALALGAFCEVRGDQHYLNQNAGLNCTAAPIYRPDGHIAGILDLSAPAQRPYRDAQRLIMQAVRHIEHRWVRSAIADRHWTLRLHADAGSLGSAQELLLVFHDEVLVAANRLAMLEFQLSPAAFGSVEFAQLFPDLLRQPSGAPHQTLAGNQRHYYSLLEAPQRRVSALRSVPPPAERHDEQHQKALRILNAGLSLCVTGETGCGKEHFSRRLFQESRWRNGNFVAINCAALPEPLIESELFGYAPGAFTGANPKGYIGKIREADGGVLFLDEIGDMPAGLQTRLLRVLQEKTVTPLGSRSAYPVDFALVCATHHDLHRQVQAGAFREDLLYRIQEYSLRIPPLRERAQLEAFILQLWRELGGERRDIRLLPEALAMLARYPWPGNVRQLLSTLKVLLALADDHAVLTLDDLPQSIAVLAPRQENDDTGLEDLQAAIGRAGGNLSRAAKALGVSRSTLYRKLGRQKAAAE
ncbi:sigma-54-dependent Fis family transcriptional regulator [Serratia marcescens]|uniref:sigma-54-dependent Fis family transcriptional regulator n=1 Tax=Serratia TaxID=613 RepID=UPI0011C7E7FD|nr:MULTISPECIES: sigma-54-dependent Fis family transcriptional regulator [Serratia]ELI8813457.1 sigma-54-dependent Fis family transcriptional regulator [Serratia marcescens]ELI8843274.1 sigma-54-dependent Fis family transcriptional regulator [Serratia marcescens]MBL0874709.1 sigma-54-dependent Fis family transcriptional regulator [Serratia nevei]NRN12603.1 sigma-54-dependent Fis family transcriptional regulator [Serratia marcescens]NRN36355.1 sigma-54-dependent Fis family transcriptional regul